jgi:hypothetical protein
MFRNTILFHFSCIPWEYIAYKFHLLLFIQSSNFKPGVYSDSNRIEYKKQRNNVSGEWSAAGA